METHPQIAQLLVGELFDLVGGVPAFDVGPQRPAFDRLGKDDCGGALKFCGRSVGGVDLMGIETTAPESPDFVVRKVFDQFAQSGVGTEEVFAHVFARLRFESLVFAVDRGVHLVDQNTVDI